MLKHTWNTAHNVSDDLISIVTFAQLPNHCHHHHHRHPDFLIGFHNSVTRPDWGSGKCSLCPMVTPLQGYYCVSDVLCECWRRVRADDRVGCFITRTFYLFTYVYLSHRSNVFSFRSECRLWAVSCNSYIKPAEWDDPVRSLTGSIVSVIHRCVRFVVFKFICDLPTLRFDNDW